jgi:hypothetical protein
VDNCHPPAWTIGIDTEKTQVTAWLTELKPLPDRFHFCTNETETTWLANWRGREDTALVDQNLRQHTSFDHLGQHTKTESSDQDG